MTKITVKKTTKSHKIYDKRTNYNNKFKEGIDNVSFANYYIQWCKIVNIVICGLSKCSQLVVEASPHFYTILVILYPAYSLIVIVASYYLTTFHLTLQVALSSVKNT